MVKKDVQIRRLVAAMNRVLDVKDFNGEKLRDAKLGSPGAVTKIQGILLRALKGYKK